MQQETKLQEAKAHEAIVQLVGFNLGKECYGVDIKRIKEINRMTEITRVPRAPEFIEGVINLRGSVIPVINLRKKVKMPSREYDKDTRIIIVELSGKTLGFIVDAVKEVLRIPESLLVPPPPLAVGKNADYITAVAKVEDELVILLDPDKVLSREETQKLEEAEGKKRK
ncbi:MAG: purine-binding chemotaxis protein CheW [Ignavibacteria bacterium]|nr:purine-binding chemotaxis protein CheW [Ignavibacteria bacterium]MCU7503592.1 purine-binding chemotaxis protein CheW [Ignavibacteria bacterium]MCU7516754.1 purine-binding chemotaxis protein CheW [Ignavibacteria bacterium]